MLRYYHKLFQVSYRLLKVRPVNLGWLLLMAILATMHIMMLNAGLVAVKAVLAILFTLGVPFEVVSIVTALTGPAEIVNQNDELLYQTWQKLKRTWPMLLGFVLLLLIVWLPFGGAGFTSTVINFIGLNGSVADFVVTHRAIAITGLGVLYLLCLGLFLWVNPRLMVRLAGTATSKGFYHRLELFFRPMLSLWVPMAAVNGGVILLARQLMSSLGQTVSRATSMVILSLLVIVTLIMLSLILVAIIWESLGRPNFNPTFDNVDGLHSMAWFPAGLVVLLIGMFSFQAFHFGATENAVVSVAHRSIINHDGVPNTIGALTQTARQHPNYVEIDVQETKDKQFVVLHSDKVALKEGQAEQPVRHFTMAQLQTMTVKEDGHTDKLSSLKQFLNLAQKKHQRVIVEVKVTNQDSSDLAKQFARQYGHQIVANQGLVHTMSYRVLTQLKAINQQLIVGYVLPFNLFSIRNLPADFYSLQAIGLSQTMVQQAHSMGAAVFTWTPDSTAQMQVMKVIGTDGQITNRADRLEKMERQKSQDYYWAIMQEIIGQFI